MPPEVTRDLALRLARLPAQAGALARTAAVLGDGASVALAARVMDVRPAVALDAVEALAGGDVLRQSGVISFSAPLLRTALYGMLAHGERSRIHRLAAQALWLGGSTAGDAAEPPDALRRRGRRAGRPRCCARPRAQALEPAAARSAYLRRALAEDPSAPPGPSCSASWPRPSSPAAAARPLGTSPRRSSCCPPAAHRAEAREQLGRVLWGLGRYEEAGRAFEDGVRGARRGGWLGRAAPARVVRGCAPASARRGRRTDRRSTRCRSSRTSGEPAMEAQLALELLLAGGPHARVVELAATALAGDRLLRQQTCCGPAFQAAVCALVWGDELEAAERATTLAIEDARRRAIEPALGVMLLLRACALSASRAAERGRAGRRGGRRARSGAAAGARPAGRRAARGGPAGARSARRRAQAAAAAVDASAAEGDRTAAGAIQHALALNARGCMELAAGDPTAALADLLDCGRRLEAAEVRNPALAPWRSRAALALDRLGEHDRAAALVAEELELANAFGAPRPIGRALAARACTCARARPHARPAGGRRGARPLACAARARAHAGRPGRRAAPQRPPARIARGAAQIPGPGRQQRRGHAREARTPGSRRRPAHGRAGRASAAPPRSLRASARSRRWRPRGSPTRRSPTA